MAWQTTHKHNTKQRILQSAAKLFTQQGFALISIDQVMMDAGLTRGAFYAHFKSKSDLYQQALCTASLEAQSRISPIQHTDLTTLASHYLSETHRNSGDKQMCPLAALISDITVQDQAIKHTYTQLFKGFVSHTESRATSRVHALQTSALMIGGLALAKALNDDSLAEELMAACQQAISQLS